MNESEEREVYVFAHDMCLQSKKLNCKSCVKCDFGKTCIYRRLAERLYKNRRYRKIHDGAVVLTKEEFGAMQNDLINAECNLNHITLQLDEIRKETAREILIYLLDGLKKQRNRYSQEYDKWDSAQKDCDREDWKADYKEKREKANGYYLMADRAIGYIKALAKEYGVEVDE